MRKRSKTFAQNAAVYLGLLAVLGVDGWFFVSHVRSQRDRERELKGQIQDLARQYEQKDNELKQADKKADEYIRAIADRKEELEGYGNFLPSESSRPEVQKFLLQTIEDLHIQILRTEEIKLSKKTHYSTLDVALKLKGTYRDFKLLLARVQKAEAFIRVKKFDLLTLDDESDHTQEVEVQFQTYFSNSGS